ncbi:hypothetical protein HYALB_00012314 [Hymenoscyphus albidus]|uniref:Zn(2)-C6 fungal-type domain-containing protein n=1 Tax=Hymenoscyphus albidus TaxID=595503 RepID=A0A9N9LIT8_9HELO|nr:hypothetical protein HYALB_00012314 [Hymenoscyphus albidus]
MEDMASISPPNHQSIDNGNGNGQASNTNTTGAVTSTSTPRSRKVACDICRERKARCDRNQPSCGRCIRFGNKCKYSPSPSERNEAGKFDVAHALETLNSRLAQAEAKLAVQHQHQHPQSDINQAAPWSDSLSRLDFDFNFSQLNTGGVDNGVMICSAGPDESLNAFSHIDFHDPIFAQVMNDSDWQNCTIDTDIDMTVSLKDPSSSSSWETSLLGNPQMVSTDPREPCSSEVMFTLFEQYFDILHPLIPILDRDRFTRALNDPAKQCTLQFKSLTYAVAMLGASVSEKHTYLEEELYSSSRTYLEITETQDKGANFWTLEALQTCVLTIWYEFKGTGFARAWMSLGRAVRLGKMVGLHRIDRSEPMKETDSFQLPLPETEDQVELEERRRTFWVLFIFDAYASVRTNSPMSICESEISITLPAASFPRGTDSSTPMPFLQKLSDITDKHPISPFAGIVLMISLHSRCLPHFQASKEQDLSGSQAYPFWVQHYSLDKKLKECENHLMGHMTELQPLALALRLNLCAVGISLHEVAIAKAQRENLPKSLITESVNRLISAANQMVDDLRIVPNMSAKNFKMWQHTSTFLMWPLSKAAEVLMDQVKASHGDIENNIASLQLVRNVMGDFRDPSGHWRGKMSEVTLLLAEKRNGPRKRKMGSLGRAPTVSPKDGTMEY